MKSSMFLPRLWVVCTRIGRNLLSLGIKSSYNLNVRTRESEAEKDYYRGHKLPYFHLLLLASSRCSSAPLYILYHITCSSNPIKNQIQAIIIN